MSDEVSPSTAGSRPVLNHPLRVLFVDMNSYFASVEQHSQPHLRGKPVAVVAVETDTTSCIAASIEAKKFGVKTGTMVGEARRMCPGLTLVKARTRVYVETHQAILRAVDTVIPVDRVCSIDEYSCRLMGTEKEVARATELGRRVKYAIYKNVGETLRCSVGIAPNRFLAKIGADMQKPDGLTVIEHSKLPGALYKLVLQDLPGIGPNMDRRLREQGIETVEQLCALSEVAMTRAWGGVVGSLWWKLLRGEDVREPVRPRRTLGHSHVLSPKRRTRDGARAVMIRLIHKAAARLRHEGYLPEHMTISVTFVGSPARKGWGRGASWGERAALGWSDDTPTMVKVFAEMWERMPDQTPMAVGVTLHDLVKRGTGDSALFTGQKRSRKLSEAMDKLGAEVWAGCGVFGGDA